MAMSAAKRPLPTTKRRSSRTRRSDETKRKFFVGALMVALACPRLVQAAHALGGQCNGLDDLGVAGAAADVAGDGLDDLRARRRGIAGQQRMRGEDHRRRAIAALHAVGLAERVLNGRELARPRRHALDGGDGIAVGLHREHQARAHRRAVDEHGAGTADAVLAAGMRAGEQQPFAQAVEQARARLDLDRVRLSIHAEFNAHARPGFRPLDRHPLSRARRGFTATRRR